MDGRMNGELLGMRRVWVIESKKMASLKRGPSSAPHWLRLHKSLSISNCDLYRHIDPPTSPAACNCDRYWSPPWRFQLPAQYFTVPQRIWILYVPLEVLAWPSFSRETSIWGLSVSGGDICLLCGCLLMSLSLLSRSQAAFPCRGAQPCSNEYVVQMGEITVSLSLSLPLFMPLSSTSLSMYPRSRSLFQR